MCYVPQAENFAQIRSTLSLVLICGHALVRSCLVLEVPSSNVGQGDAKGAFGGGRVCRDEGERPEAEELDTSCSRTQQGQPRW